MRMSILPALPPLLPHAGTAPSTPSANPALWDKGAKLAEVAVEDLTPLPEPEKTFRYIYNVLGGVFMFIDCMFSKS